MSSRACLPSRHTLSPVQLMRKLRRRGDQAKVEVITDPTFCGPIAEQSLPYLSLPLFIL